MIGQPPTGTPADATDIPAPESAPPPPPKPLPPEVGGRPGPEPTRYGDWEKDGRCIDF